MNIRVPLLKQWDERWGSHPYANSTIAQSGCGPTSFAMIAQAYNINVTPDVAGDYAVDNGYYPANGGTSWELFSAIGEYYGVPMHQTSDPGEVLAALQRGIPCIGAHGPGEFTQSGHFIVYAYVTKEELVMVNDPNRDDTCKLYDWGFLVQDNIGNEFYVAFIPQNLLPS